MTAPNATQSCTAARPSWRSWVYLLLILLSTGGCSLSGCFEFVMHDYGSRRAREQSVNGVDVLGNMFRRTGHRVRSWRFLSPSLKQADVIVWFPDDLEPPTPEVQGWLYDWLASTESNSPPRTLIYVGRDYDASVLYWQSVQGKGTAQMNAEYRSELLDAQNRAKELRDHTFTRTTCEEWFSIESDTNSKQVTGLQGPWADGIDPTKIAIARGHRLVPDDGFTTLLADQDGNAIASECFFDVYYNYGGPDSRLLVIENGSWLLNAALLNDEHRKLAGKVVSQVGPPRLDVVFLQSGPGGPPIRDTDPNGAPPTGLALFGVWPIGAVLTQAAVLGLLFTLMCWPIFGTPRRLVRRSLTDFGSHITALGQMLRQTRDRGYAVHTLRLYWKSLDRKSGAATQVASPAPEQAAADQAAAEEVAPEQVTLTAGPPAL